MKFTKKKQYSIIIKNLIRGIFLINNLTEVFIKGVIIEITKKSKNSERIVPSNHATELFL